MSTIQENSNTNDNAIDDAELLKCLLKEKNVPSNASWEYAIKLMESDSRFERVRSYPNRKQIFNDYKIQRAKDDREQQRLKARRAREQLEQFLLNDPRVTGRLRYRHACKLFENLEQWTGVNDEEREDIFIDTVELIDKREREAARALRQRNISELRNILDSMPQISAHTTWFEAQKMLLENEQFALDQQLLAMDKEDALIVFMDHIRQLEMDEEDERRRERYRRSKLERDNRRAFVQYLEELHESGKLTWKSKWQSLYAEISADSRYSALLSQPLHGSTALDLFKFYVDELREHYERDYSIIMHMLKHDLPDYYDSITLETNLTQFQQKLVEFNRSIIEKCDKNNLKEIYERIMDKKRDEDRAKLKQLNKERRRIEHAFITLLWKHFDQQLDNNEPLDYEKDVKSIICEDPAYLAISSDEERKSIFERFIQSLNDSCLHHHTKPKKSSRAYSSNSPPVHSSHLVADNQYGPPHSRGGVHHHHHHHHTSVSPPPLPPHPPMSPQPHRHRHHINVSPPPPRGSIDHRLSRPSPPPSSRRAIEHCHWRDH